jgi:hypothetical protein
MIKLYDLNEETKEMLNGLEDCDLDKILRYAETLMSEISMHPAARFGCNAAVELACAIVVWANFEWKGELQ